MYTPLNPLDRHASKMATKPIMDDLRSYGLLEPWSDGHYKE